MIRELEVTVPPEDQRSFVQYLTNWRERESAGVKSATSDSIRAEHEAYADAADRLLGAVSDHPPGDALTVTADDPATRFVLAMVVDGVLREVARAPGELEVIDYDGFDRAAESIRYWSAVARDLNVRADKLEGVGV